MWWMLGLFAGTAAHAGGLDRLSLSAGVAGFGAGATNGGALGSGYLSARILDWLYVDGGTRVGVFAGDTRYIASVSLGGRAMVFQDVLFARVDLLHQHETAIQDYIDDPIMTTIGAAPAIGHRSGVDAGGGIRYTVPIDAVGMHVDFSGLATVFPDDVGPKVYGVFETVFTMDLGRPQRIHAVTAADVGPVEPGADAEPDAGAGS